MDLAAAPYGCIRLPVEARMEHRIFSRFHLDAGIVDVLMDPLETSICPGWLGFVGGTRAAHIFLCVMAYYVKWHLRRAWAPLLFEDEERWEERQHRNPVAVAEPPARCETEEELQADTRRPSSA